MYSLSGVVAKKPKAPAPPPEPPEGEVFLREWRKKYRKSLQWVADEIGSDIGTLSEIERLDGPEAPKARGRWAFSYAKALGISPEMMLRHPDAPPTTRERIANAPAELLPILESIIVQFNQRGG